MVFENFDEFHKYMETYRAMENALSSTVKISHREVDRITVNRLIAMRNAPCMEENKVKSLDTVLRYFLEEEEFEKYVINKEPLPSHS